MKTKTIKVRKLKLNRETLLTLKTTELDAVNGGIAGQSAFPCWTENNCPSPA